MTNQAFNELIDRAKELKEQRDGLRAKLHAVVDEWIGVEERILNENLSRLRDSFDGPSEAEEKQDKQDRHADYLRDRGVDRAA